MTVGEWLAARSAGVPPHLASHLREALGDSLAADASEVPARCIDAAERLVGTLLRAGETGREGALPLLTADALVTYAFEAAAAEPDRLHARAASAMQVLATLR